MMAVAEAAQKWPELDVKVFFKLIKGVEADAKDSTRNGSGALLLRISSSAACSRASP